MRSPLLVAVIGLLAPYWLVDSSRYVFPMLALGLMVSYWRHLRWLLLMVVAFGYSNLQVQQQLQQQLRECPNKLRVQTSLRILETQQPTAETTRFIAAVHNAQNLPVEANKGQPSCQLVQKQRLRLSWKNAPELVPGSIFQMSLVISEPWGYQNPGGFSYERWLLGAQLAATGYVRSGELLSAAPPDGFWRQIRISFAQVLAGYPQAALLKALVLGDTSQMNAAHWQRLRLGGAVHLLVVSGLHIGLVASALFFAMQLLARLTPWLVARVPARRFAVVGALLGSAAFLWLTGAEVPGVRAWFMLCAGLLCLGQGRRLDPWVGYLWVLLLVLLIIPSSAWQQGFYLSFGAVGALLLFFQPRSAVVASFSVSQQDSSIGLLRWLGFQIGVLVQIQLTLLVSMAPLGLVLGLATPTLGFAINLVAVPWISLVVVPLALLGTLSILFSDSISHLLLSAASKSLVSFDRLLELAQMGSLWQPPQLGWSQQLFFGLLCLLTLTPLGWRVRSLLIIGGIALLLTPANVIPLGHFRVLVFDVGQGSSILVSTRKRNLLFDSGPAYSSGFSAAEALVVPSLGALNIRRLDSFIVSHEDNDHAGGAHQVRHLLRPTTNLQGGLTKVKQGIGVTLPCAAGQHWIWDQVHFEMLSPAQARSDGASSNDQSCVLRITSKADHNGNTQRALLFGDISQSVELRLLHKLQPQVALMLAPHHGSSTSSSRALVRRLQPKLVVASAARHSRYRHPHSEVVARYCDVGARFFVTGEAGAVTWRSSAPQQVYPARMLATPWRSARSLRQLDRCR